MTLVNQEKKFDTVISQILPYLDKKEDYFLLAYVMVTLKLEGILGEQLTTADKHMVSVIQESLKKDSRKKHHALLAIKKVLKTLPSSPKN